MAYYGRVVLLMAGGFLFFVIGRGLSLRINGVFLKPQVEVTPLEIDLGTVQVNKAVECEIVLHNIGKKLLLIKQVKSTCECTVPQIVTGVLAPGESEVVIVSFTPKIVGFNLQRVMFETNDPKQPMRVFTLRAHSVPATQPQMSIR